MSCYWTLWDFYFTLLFLKYNLHLWNNFNLHKVTGHGRRWFSVQCSMLCSSYTLTEHDLWWQPVACYLSWLCSSSISVLCSVTVFRNCWFVCVWQERHDCHLCGMIANTAPTLTTSKSTLSLIHFSVSFYIKPRGVSVSDYYKASHSPCCERNRLLAWTVRGGRACLPIKNALEGYSITIQSLYTVYCDQAPGVCVCAFTSFCVNKKNPQYFVLLNLRARLSPNTGQSCL